MTNIKVQDLLFAAVFIGLVILAGALYWESGQGFGFFAAMAALLAGFLLVFAFTEHTDFPKDVGVSGAEAQAIADPNKPERTPENASENGTEKPLCQSETAVFESYDSFPVAMLRIEPDDTVSHCNLAAREMLGLAARETPRFDDLLIGLGRSLPAWVNSIRNSGDKSVPEMLETKRDNGASMVQVCLMDTPFTPAGTLLVTLSDATQLQSLQAQFVQSQKMQAIGQLAGGVAHDFNNLLTAISGYCDLLLLRHERGDPDYGDLVQISQNSNRAAALVGQLLAFSRKQTLQPQVLRVNDALSELTHLLNRLLGEKVRLNTEYGRDLPNVYVDERQLEQVIMNLVVNARDAMPEGGEVQITSDKVEYKTHEVIQKATVPAGVYVSIQVSDSGCGIRKDNLQKIFEPFFSTKNVGEGTGLGLSMVYGIIKQTGGFIFVDSTHGKGTRFTILLPEHADGVVVETISSKPEPRKAKALNGQSVLLVEDEAPVRAFASRALKMHGVDVTEASSAEQALEILADPDHIVDIIVSDVVMPGMDGPTWVRRARETRPDVQVIFVSGYAEESFTRDHSEILNAAFLPKPFSLKQLIEKVRELAR